METRINKYLTEAGYCSRRKAERLVLEGRVLINGQTAVIGQKVGLSDTVFVDGKEIKKLSTHIYLAYHKPIGVICTTDQTIKGNIVDAINYPKRLFHVGRLDKDSSGLILMTNDGSIVNEILRQENNHEKEYIVRVDKPITPSFLKNMQNGVEILGRVTKPAMAVQKSENTFHLTITEGLNRQIRRMCKALNYKVIALQRIRIMHIHLDVPVNKYRHLTPLELDVFKNNQ